MAEAYICSLSKVQRHAEICKEMLKRIGVDVEAWNHERREPNEAEKH